MIEIYITGGACGFNLRVRKDGELVGYFMGFVSLRVAMNKARTFTPKGSRIKWSGEPFQEGLTGKWTPKKEKE